MKSALKVLSLTKIPFISALLPAVTADLFASAGSFKFVENQSVCTVRPSSDGSDDGPAIISAFSQCAENATVLFENETYHIESVMETVWLKNVYIDLQGTLLWGTNISYWVNNSLPMGYQNQSTAWIFGGDNVTFDGHGYGTFDGNGQVWYDYSNGESNTPGRPVAITISNTTNSLFTGIRFVQSQFWTMTVRFSENVLLDNIYVNSTSNSSAPTQNTDGADTIYSNKITFRNWSITNGDDSISPKANSSNIVIQDSTFYHGNGIAIGSIGQYKGIYEFIENVTAERIVCHGCMYPAYVKTWTGVQQEYPPNGGGGGLGYARNLVFRNITSVDTRNSIAEITQCTSYSGATGGCDTSQFQISNVTWGPISGNVLTGTLANLQCSGAAPCPDIHLVDGLSGVTTNSSESRNISCSNVVDPVGFECSDGS